MRKWRTSYALKQSKKLLKDEAGITLVELLAAISILSIVILLAGSVHMFGQRQFTEQSQSASQANNMSYALTTISKDLRRRESSTIDVIDGDIIQIDKKPVYMLQQNQLIKNGEILAHNVKGSNDEIQVFTKETDGIIIKLETSEDIRPKKRYETKIYFRRR